MVCAQAETFGVVGRACLLGILISAAPARAQQNKPAASAPVRPVTVLDGSGVWRVVHSWNAPLIQTPQGTKERRVKSGRVAAQARPDFRFMTRYPAPGWTGVGFDDSAWCRRHFFVKYVNGEIDGRAGGGAGSPCLRQLSLRGKFTVTDPSKVASLRLTAAFRGGAAVYLNGKELKRLHLPGGKIAPGCPAEIYPVKAYLNDAGKPWQWIGGDMEAVRKTIWPRRVRRIEDLPVPAGLLRKGTNVLAIEIHAAPYPAAFGKAKLPPRWATCGLVEVRLKADTAAGIVPNVVRPKGFQVWNTNVAADLYDVDWGDPHDPLRPIALAAPQNGWATGRVVASCDKPIRGLAATVGALAGPKGATIPASAVNLRYGAFDGIGSASGPASLLFARHLPAARTDGMLDAPPEVVPVAKKALGRGVPAARKADGLPASLTDGAVLPIYVSVHIPKTAPPGDYRGTLTIAAKDEKGVRVPVEVKVVGWTLPDPPDFGYWCGMIQSPEGVGLRYGVPLWSDAHWKFIGRSFDVIAQLGSRVVFVPLGAETEYGNSESMVLWVPAKRPPPPKDADEEDLPKGPYYTHDFTRVEKYLDVAMEHLGKPNFVVVGVWQFCEFGKSPRITLLDPKTGRRRTIEGPKHGTDESKAFWDPVLTRMKAILKQRGLDGRMLLGYISDRVPGKATVGVFHKILPRVSWQGQRHPPRGAEYLVHDGGWKPVLYQSNVWGCGSFPDPTVRRHYGWKYSDGVAGGVRTWLNRGVYDRDAVVAYRGLSENILLSNRRGQGQIGADFWPAPAAKPGTRRRGTLYSRYPHSQNVGAGNKGVTANQLLYPGPAGAVPTVRFEILREGIQECEARIFLEKLLLEKPHRPRLAGVIVAQEVLDQRALLKKRAEAIATLPKFVQPVLDERVRWQRMQSVAFQSHLSWPHSGWEARAIKLYATAAAAAKAIEGLPEPPPPKPKSRR